MLIVLFVTGLSMIVGLSVFGRTMPTLAAAEAVAIARYGAITLVFVCQFLFPIAFPRRETPSRRRILRTGLSITIVYAISAGSTLVKWPD